MSWENRQFFLKDLLAGPLQKKMNRYDVESKNVSAEIDGMRTY